MGQSIKVLKYIIPLIFGGIFLASCGGDSSGLSSGDRTVVKSQVGSMMATMGHDVTNKGPLAWFNYFEDSGDFFMVSDGALVFQNYKAMKGFILNKLVKNTLHINLQLTQIRVDPLSTKLASVAAGFHEDLTNASGKTLSIDGYLTGTAHLNANTWKLQNLSWSIKPIASH